MLEGASRFVRIGRLLTLTSANARLPLRAGEPSFHGSSLRTKDRHPPSAMLNPLTIATSAISAPCMLLRRHTKLCEAITSNLRALSLQNPCTRFENPTIQALVLSEQSRPLSD